MTPEMTRAYLAMNSELQKLAMNKLTKHLLKANPKELKEALGKLPPHMKQHAAHKLLGNKARQAVQSSMPEGAGHGAQHVWDVTRDAQKFLGGRFGDRPADLSQATKTIAGLPKETYQRGTLASLLHDIGRPAEGKALHSLNAREVAAGKPKTKAMNMPLDIAHSELSGRHAKNFLARNQQLAQMAGGLDRGRLSNAIRAHDTDAHKAMPWTPGVLKRDPAAASTYLADKAQGMGQIGVDRTVETGQHFGQTPAQSYDYAIKKNLPKYQAAIENFSPSPMVADDLTKRLATYHTGMTNWAAQQRVKPAMRAQRLAQMTPIRQPAAQPAPQMGKVAMSQKPPVTKGPAPYINLFKKALTRNTRPEVLARAVRMLQRGDEAGSAQAFGAIYKMPENTRMRLLQAMSAIKKVKK